MTTTPPLPEDLAKSLGIGCGDSGCITGISKGGQHTNGGCRCLRDKTRTGLRLLAERLVHHLRESMRAPCPCGPDECRGEDEPGCHVAAAKQNVDGVGEAHLMSDVSRREWLDMHSPEDLVSMRNAIEAELEKRAEAFADAVKGIKRINPSAQIERRASPR